MIGDLVIDTGRQQVSRGATKLELTKLSYRLLLVLAEAAPDVVSHDQLVDAVWQGRIVSPETVIQRIRLLRKALGDDAAEPKYVGVRRGVGYQLLVDVTPLPDDEASVGSVLLTELRRRRVIPVALIYVAFAWSLCALASILLPEFDVLPPWSARALAIACILGFPVTLVVAWHRDRGIGRGSAEPTVRHGREVYAAAIALLATATSGLGYLLYPAMAPPASPDDALAFLGERRAEPNSLAVLPFDFLGRGSDERYLSEGLSSGLREHLVGVSGLRVAARSSSVQFRDRPVGAVTVAARLGVRHVVEAAVTANDRELSISVQLIDGETGYQRWADTFTGTRQDVPDLERRIAEQIIARVLPQRAASITGTQPPTTDGTAHELMWLGGYYLQQVREEAVVDDEALQRSINYYQRAVANDPDSPQAHSRLASALLHQGDAEAAGASIARALSINPDLSEVQYTLGLYLWSTYGDGTGVAFKKAVELNPYNADALEAYAKWIWHQKIYDEPEAYFLRALETDSMAINRFGDIGNYYGMSGQRDKARSVVTRILERFPGDPNAYRIVARILELTGDLDEGIAWAKEAFRLNPDDEESAWMLAELYARLGDFETARQFDDGPAFNLLYWERRYEDMIDLGEELVLERPDEVQLWYGLARAYNAVEDYRAAVRALESRGLPQRAISENRRANDQEALVLLADAYKQLGELTRANELAGFMEGRLLERQRASGGSETWWYYLYAACTSSILGRREEALDRLEGLHDTSGLPWYPMLVDAPCFRELREEPRYRAVVAAVESRKRQLMNRLPQTLAEFGKQTRLR